MYPHNSPMKHYDHSHFINVETDALKLSNFPQVTHARTHILLLLITTINYQILLLLPIKKGDTKSVLEGDNWKNKVI